MLFIATSISWAIASACDGGDEDGAVTATPEATAGQLDLAMEILKTLRPR